MPKQPDPPPELGPLLSEVVRVKAAQFGLPEMLVRAIVIVESQGNPHAFRAEPKYGYVWDCVNGRPFRALGSAEVASMNPPRGFMAQPGLIGESRATEWIGQKTSWGPMQVMGGTARWLGFKGWFTELDDAMGVYYGCKYLRNRADKWLAPYGWAGVGAAYNAHVPVRTGLGTWQNQEYVNRLAEAGCDFRLL